MKASSILRKAKELIKNPKSWCKDTSAKDIYGVYVPFNDECAYKFCALGALARVGSGKSSYDKARNYLESCSPDYFVYTNGCQPNAGYFVASFNDSPKTKHKDVMSLFEKAIYKARKAKE